jgi:hypothetical protein
VRCPHARVQVGVESLQLVFDLGLGLPADLLPGPLTVRAEAERDNATPPARAAPVMAGVVALTHVIEIDGVFAKATPAHAQNATTWLPAWLPKIIELKPDRVSELVELSGAHAAVLETGRCVKNVQVNRCTWCTGRSCAA